MCSPIQTQHSVHGRSSMDVISPLWSLQLRSYGWYGGKKYEILKIWVPTHGVVNVYRKPGRPAGTGAFKKVHRWNARGVESFPFIEYHVDNRFLIGESVHRHHLEKIRVLAFHGSVITITITRDPTVLVQQVHRRTSEFSGGLVWSMGGCMTDKHISTLANGKLESRGKKMRFRGKNKW